MATRYVAAAMQIADSVDVGTARKKLKNDTKAMKIKRTGKAIESVWSVCAHASTVLLQTVGGSSLVQQ